ncbi:MAG: DUF1150 family protein [Rhizobiales bacterium]|nr:DUF1150 family protein [Hyphomicrobiales bacterium]
MEKTFAKLDDAALAALGGGVIGYVKEIEGEDAVKLLGERIEVPPDAKLYCLYNADGSPISISGSREAAFSSAMEHELVAASVH